jgi:vesicle-fusing ATPase
LDVVDLNVLKKGEVDARREIQSNAFRGILMRETNIEFSKLEGSFVNLKVSRKKA